MSEERFAFGPEVFGLDDRKSVEAVIHLLDRTYEQAHAEQSAEDVLYDFCIAYLEQAKKQETLSEEDANKRLKVIVQWYAQQAESKLFRKKRQRTFKIIGMNGCMDRNRCFPDCSAKNAEKNTCLWMKHRKNLHRKHRKQRNTCITNCV